MKILSITLIAISLTLAATSAHAKFDQDVNDKICDIVENNDKVVLHQTVKSIQLSMNTLYQNVNCQGQNILQFSIDNKADVVSQYVIKKTSRKYLVEDAELYADLSTELAKSDVIKSIHEKIKS